MRGFGRTSVLSARLGRTKLAKEHLRGLGPGGSTSVLVRMWKSRVLRGFAKSMNPLALPTAPASMSKAASARRFVLTRPRKSLVPQELRMYRTLGTSAVNVGATRSVGRGQPPVEGCLHVAAKQAIHSRRPVVGGQQEAANNRRPAGGVQDQAVILLLGKRTKTNERRGLPARWALELLSRALLLSPAGHTRRTLEGICPHEAAVQPQCK